MTAKDLKFEFTTTDTEISITAKFRTGGVTFEAEEESTGLCWEVEIDNQHVSSLTRHICDRGDQLIHLLNQAKSGNKFSLLVEKRRDLQDKKKQQIAVVVTKQPDPWSDEKEFTFILQAITLNKVEQVERIASRNAKKLGYLFKTQGEAFDPRFCHESLIRSKNNRALTESAVNVHAVATTGIPYSTGRHYWAIKVVKYTGNSIFCGVCRESGEGGIVGHTGDGLNGFSFLTNGNIYPGPLGYGRGFAPSGSTVGVFLDMDKKVVRFSVNGWEGEELSLGDGPYFFHCSLYSQFDSIELLPEFCWHK